MNKPKRKAPNRSKKNIHTVFLDDVMTSNIERRHQALDESKSQTIRRAIKYWIEHVPDTEIFTDGR